MAAIRFPEFLASLENTNYPFVPSATLSNGDVTFLEGTFLDAHIYPVDGAGRYYLSRVVVETASITIYVGDTQLPLRLSASLVLPTLQETVQLVDESGRPGGVLVSSGTRLALFAGWGTGTYDFERQQTEFAVTCCVPVPDPGVTGIKPAGYTAASGRVWLLGENGVVLDTASATDSAGHTYEVVTVHVVGDPLYLQKLCEPEAAFTPVNPVRAIRILSADEDYTCYPDSRGNFNIQANAGLVARPALRVRTTPEGIVVRAEGSSLN